jgi:hypothetical protein
MTTARRRRAKADTVTLFSISEGFAPVSGQGQASVLLTDVCQIDDEGARYHPKSVRRCRGEECALQSSTPLQGVSSAAAILPLYLPLEAILLHKPFCRWQSESSRYCSLRRTKNSSKTSSCFSEQHPPIALHRSSSSHRFLSLIRPS